MAMNLKRQFAYIGSSGTDFGNSIKRDKLAGADSTVACFSPRKCLSDSCLDVLLQDLAHSHQHMLSLPASRMNDVFAKSLHKLKFSVSDFLATGRLAALLRLFKGSRLCTFQLDSWTNTIDGTSFIQALSSSSLCWKLLRLSNCSLGGNTSTRKPSGKTGIALDCLDLSGSIFLSSSALDVWSPLILSAKGLICNNWTGKLPLSSADVFFLADLAKIIGSPHSKIESISCCFNGSVKFLSGLMSRWSFMTSLTVKVSSDDVPLLFQILEKMCQLKSLSIIGDENAPQLDRFDGSVKRRLTSLTLQTIAISSYALFEGFNCLKVLTLREVEFKDGNCILQALRAMEFVPKLCCLAIDQAVSGAFLDGLDDIYMLRPWLRIRMSFDCVSPVERIFYNVDILE